MCGRFTLVTTPEATAEFFELMEVPDFAPRYNIAPTQQVGTVLFDAESGQRSWRWMRWGMIPSWAKDKSIGSKLINARAETLHEKPSFRSAFKERRCLIPASGFFEWKKVGKTKQAHHVSMNDGRPMAFAGLWDHWTSEAGEGIHSFSIVTTAPNTLVRELHDRMPAIVPRGDFAEWLSPQGNSQDLAQLLRPLPEAGLKVEPVGQRVNGTDYDGPECIQPIYPATLF